MKTRRAPPPEQLGFGALLAAADDSNARDKRARACAHLPDTYDEAVPYLRALIDRHHAAMIAGDATTAMPLREDAHRLAEKLNNYEPGILAGDDAPGCRLDRLTRARTGRVPLWGQSGRFTIDLDGMRVAIALDGIFGLTWSVYHWPGFGAYAVDWHKPFLTETGFRSFIAINAALQPGYTPDRFAREVIEGFIARENKGKLRTIKPEYRARHRERLP